MTVPSVLRMSHVLDRFFSERGVICDNFKSNIGNVTVPSVLRMFWTDFSEGDVKCITLKKTAKVKVPSEGSCWLFFGNVSYKCLAVFLHGFLQRTTNGRSRLVDSTDSTNRLRQLFFQH